MLSQMLAWASYLLTWTWLIWLGAAVLIGSVLLVSDECRMRRTKPQPHEVRAYADNLKRRHGREAALLNGEAMYDAQLGGDFDCYRFMREVSGELMIRLAPETTLLRAGDD